MSNRHYLGWQVGMEVCVVRTLNVRDPKPVMEKIIKIGRRWITIDSGFRNDRFDSETNRLDGGQYASPGKIYATEEEYLETTGLRTEWAELRASLPYVPPDHISREDLRKIKTILTGAKEPNP
jgi:hypothetical protein